MNRRSLVGWLSVLGTTTGFSRAIAGTAPAAPAAPALEPSLDAAGATGLRAASQPSGSASRTITDPKELLSIYRRAAWTADDRVTFSWLHGTRYALIDSAFTPLWEMHIGNWFRVRDLDGGAFEVAWVTANLYSELDTDRLLETLRNPFTNRDVTIPYRAPRVSKRVFGPEGQRGSFSPEGYRSTRNTALGPAWIEGDALWIRGDMAYRGEPTVPGKPLIQVNDWSTYVGSARELLDPRIRNPQASQAFSDINTWPDWLGMGDRQGNFVSRCFGRKAFSYGEMPAAWRALVERKYPDVARDPLGVLERGSTAPTAALSR